MLNKLMISSANFELETLLISNECAGMSQGELLRESQLPAPWGPKPHKADPAVAACYQPKHYPEKIVITV